MAHRTPLRAPYKFDKIEDFPALDKGTVQTILWLGLTGIFLVFWQRFYRIDPWANDAWNVFPEVSNKDSYWVAFLILLAITIGIALKQYNYYFRDYGAGKKDGIFITRIRQGCLLESYLDLSLTIVGGLLFFFLLMPIWWFLLLCIYSILVISRCMVTTKRERYAGTESILWTTLFEKFKEELLPIDVLHGWIISHSIVAAYSGTAFIALLFGYPVLSENMMIFGIAIQKILMVLLIIVIGLFIIYFQLSGFSLRAAGKIFKTHRPQVQKPQK